MDDLWVVLPHLGAGGAQKVGLLAAEHFAEQGLRVRVLSLRPEHPVKHRLPENVTTFSIDLCPDEELHPWLRDGWNRSLLARARRFSIAQLIRYRRLLIRLITQILVLILQLLPPRFDRQFQPGCRGLAGWLLAHCISSAGGLRYARLRALLVDQRPRRGLALLSKTNILCCAAAWDLPIHLVVSERNDPRLQTMERLWRWLRRVYYRRADVVTANTEGVLEALQEMGTWRRLELLPNPLPALVSTDRSPSSTDRRQEILSVARLVPQKGLDLLLRAFASLPESVRFGWTLVLVGDGPEREQLQSLGESLSIADAVRFEGFQSNPMQYMQSAAVFALPSRFEGMPNALLEAMASGLPAVVTDASPGPLEMVSDGRNGLVVPTEDPVAFAAALHTLMATPERRLQLGEAARQTLRSMEWPVVEPLWRSVLGIEQL